MDDRGTLLGDTAAVTALLERLLHYAHVLKCGPRSCDHIVTKQSVFLSARFSTAIHAALSIVRASEWADQIGPGTEPHVTVNNPEATHRVTLERSDVGVTAWRYGRLKF